MCNVYISIGYCVGLIMINQSLCNAGKVNLLNVCLVRT